MNIAYDCDVDGLNGTISFKSSTQFLDVGDRIYLLNIVTETANCHQHLKLFAKTFRLQRPSSIPMLPVILYGPYNMDHMIFRRKIGVSL